VVIYHHHPHDAGGGFMDTQTELLRQILQTQSQIAQQLN
jgi:hypothetical protein